MAAWFKTAGSIGSAPSDPVKDQAALAPIPSQAIENKPAPGQTGPRGMAPRTTYSRVNTGSPPTMDAGAMGQKSGPTRGMEFLPAKVAAQRGFMTTMHVRPSLQDMVKAAMNGTVNAMAVNLEAARQSSGEAPAVKVASQSTDPDHVETTMVNKLASALSFIEAELLKEAEGPGDGPGALQVTQADNSGTSMDAGESGQATPKHQQPTNPPLQADKVQEGNAGTGLETNDSMMFGEQPTEPIKNAAANVLARLQKTAAPVLPSGAGHMGRKAMGVAKGAVGAVKNLGSKAVSKGKEVGGKAVSFAKEHPKSVGGAAVGAAAAGTGAAFALKGKDKKASAPIAVLRKLAEDAINPAQISSPKSVDPAAPPPGASAAGEQVPGEPSDVTSQKSMISSNEAAINYTKGQAKADPKKDVNQVLTEPALSSAHDKVLQEAFEATGRAGVKISSVVNMRKTASQVGASRNLLAELLKKASADVEKANNASVGR